MSTRSNGRRYVAASSNAKLGLKGRKQPVTHNNKKLKQMNHTRPRKKSGHVKHACANTHVPCFAQQKNINKINKQRKARGNNKKTLLLTTNKFFLSSSF